MSNWPLWKGYSLLQNGQFGSKTKIALQGHYGCSLQETVDETANMRKMRRF